jgi:hypothetical protein
LGKFNLTVTDIINAIQSQNVQPQSPKKREFFKYLPEKHAIGGPFCEY